MLFRSLRKEVERLRERIPPSNLRAAVMNLLSPGTDEDLAEASRRACWEWIDIPTAAQREVERLRTLVLGTTDQAWEATKRGTERIQNEPSLDKMPNETHLPEVR